MIKYTTGDLLKSNADALVNTVNCEGYMGKGIAYQFKLQYPENNKDYIKACRNGALTIGKLHFFNEKNKLIINFPTKDKWREKSKLEYIEKGLDQLVTLIKEKNIKSIAIPPLGSGNGGLVWAEVKHIIQRKLDEVSSDVDILIYEPSINYIAKPSEEPKLSLSALILMEIKRRLNTFDKTRLQKTAFFCDLPYNERYFNFKKHKYGPYDNSIMIISKSIKEFQDYHNVKEVNVVYSILYKKVISESVEKKLSIMLPRIEAATELVNSIKSNHELECLSTIAYIIDINGILDENSIIKLFNSWSSDKALRFNDKEIKDGILRLIKLGIINETLVGYSVNKEY